MGKPLALSNGAILQRSVGGRLSIVRSLPAMPAFAAGPTSVPLELTQVNRTEDKQGFENDMNAMMAFKTNAAAAGWDFTATQSGWFDDPGTWGGAGVPTTGHTATIPDGVNVWIRSDVGALTLLWLDGFLGVSPDASVTINIDTFLGSRTSRFWCGDETTPFTGEMTWLFPASDLDLAFDPRMQSKCFMTMGRTRFHGKAKAAFMLTDGTDLTAGATSVTLAGTPVGWEVGDTIVIPPTEFILPSGWGSVPPASEPGNYVETRVITGVNGNTVTWSDPLEYDHSMPANASWSDIHIINQTRNISFESPPSAPVHQRGHMMLMASDDQDIRYVEFGWVGRSDKREDGWDFDDHPDNPANGGAGMQPDSNIKARYGGVHFHATGPDGANITVMGCSVHSAFSLGFVSHRSNVDFVSNCSANMWGAGLMTESGNEAGLIQGFVAIGHKTDRPSISNKQHDDEDRHDWGHAQMIWMQSRLTLVRNIAAYGGSNALGIIWNTRGNKAANIRPATLERRDIREITHNSEFHFPNETYNQHTAQIIGPTIDADGMRSVACLQSVQVEKSGSQQDHFDYSQLRNVQICNVARGLHVEYTGRYIIDMIEGHLQPGAEGFVGNLEAGVSVAIESFQFTVRRAHFTGFEYGIKYGHVTVPVVPETPGREFVPDANWHNFIIGPVTGSARVALIHPDFGTGDHVDKDELVDESALDLNPALPTIVFDDVEVPATDEPFLAEDYVMGATTTDSLGTRSHPAGRDRFRLHKHEIWGGLRANGFWEEAGTGRYFFEMPELLRDAATGVLKKYTRRVYLAAGSFSNDPRGAPSPWINGGWVNNGTKA